MPFRRLVLPLGLLAWLLTGATCGRPARLVDVEQDRFDQPALLVQGSQTIGQTFVARHSGLAGVEVLLVVHSDEETPAPGIPLTFYLRRSLDQDEDLYKATIDTASLRHNQRYQFSFPPRVGAQDQRYYFFLEAPSENKRVTVWRNSVDAYGDGSATVGGELAEGDLVFKTFYEYDARAAVQDVAHGSLRYGWLMIPGLILFFLPGHLLRSVLLPDPIFDQLESFAASVGLSLALVPLGLLFTTTLGLSVTQPVALAGATALVVIVVWREVTADFRRLKGALQEIDLVVGIALSAVLVVTFALRFLHIRDLALPPWVDSVHHTMITQLLVREGGVPDSFRPFIPVDRFFYHFGFHALSAAFHWLTRVSVPQSVLIVGQIINGLTALGGYLLARRLTGRQWAGMVAALVTGILSLMPSYYLTWGRYTQLAGLALLPTSVFLTMATLEADEFELRLAVLACVAIGGLLLVHYRVFVFYLAFVAAYMIYRTVASWRRWEAVVPAWKRTPLLAVGAALLASPWILHLIRAVFLAGNAQFGLGGVPEFNTVPQGLIFVGRYQELMPLAVAGFLWGLINRDRAVLVTLLWALILIVLTNPGIVGLSNTWLLSNQALAISVFVPVAILLGYFFASLAQLRRSTREAVVFAAGWIALIGGATQVGGPIGVWLDEKLLNQRLPFVLFSVPVILAVGHLVSQCRHSLGERSPHWRKFYRVGLLGTALVLALWGGMSMLSVINPVTVIATAEDVEAMRWIEESLPPDATILVNTRLWQGSTYVGADGGYWIPLLTDRKTILPPALYIYGHRPYVKRINELGRIVAEAKSLDEPRLCKVLRDAGVTHAYVGAKGGGLSPRTFLGNPAFRPVYSSGAVWVFALNGVPCE